EAFVDLQRFQQPLGKVLKLVCADGRNEACTSKALQRVHHSWERARKPGHTGGVVLDEELLQGIELLVVDRPPMCGKRPLDHDSASKTHIATDFTRGHFRHANRSQAVIEAVEEIWRSIDERSVEV